MIKDFGKYVEDVKHGLGKGGKDHLSFDELKKLAKEFKNEWFRFATKILV